MRFALAALVLVVGTLSVPEAGAATASVSIQGFAFSPNSVVIAVGDTVTWTNMDGAAHTATSSAGAPAAFNTGTISNGQSKSHTFTTAGTYSYFCSFHPSMTATVTVQGAPANAAPSVAFTSPASAATVSGTVAVTGTASDGDGDALTVTLSIDGGAAVAVSGSTSWSYNWDTTGVPDGSRTLRVTANDGKTSTSATRVVTVSNAPPNAAPVVTIAAPAEGATVTGTAHVSGTASDADGDPLTVTLRIDGGAPISVSGSNSWAYSWNTASVAEGAHTLVATVSDGKTTSTSATRTVHVARPPPENRAPVVAISEPSHGADVSGLVQVRGTASDPDGESFTVRLRVDGGTPMAVTGGASWTYAWDTSALSPGPHTLLAVADDGRVSSTSATVTVNVREAPQPNRPPNVVIISPAQGARVSGVVEVNGIASDPDGTPVVVRIEADGAAPTVLPHGSWTYAWDTTGLGPGPHDLVATADDGTLSTRVTLVVEVVGPAANRPPVVRILSPANGTLVSGLVSITGEGTDPDGDAIVYQVGIDENSWFALPAGNSFTYVWNATLEAPGEHTITVRADDTRGGSDTASLTLIVEAPDLIDTRREDGPSATPGIAPFVGALVALAAARLRRRA